MKTFHEVFPGKKPIIGVIHLKGDSTDEIRERAKREIAFFVSGGLDGIIVEDYFGTYSHLVWTLDYLARQKPGLPYGVNCLNFDSLCFQLARDYACDFLQVDSVVGHVKPRDEASLDAFFSLERPRTEALVLGGVRFKYQPVLSAHSLEEDLVTARGRCDAVCVTGDGTGIQAPTEKIAHFKESLGDFPLIVCSGLNEDNCIEQLRIADGAVVGSFFKDTGKDTGDVDPAKIRRLMDKVRQLRAER
ncbi:MAG: membrane biogenesis protein [Oscillospiraceae bacterium]|nr:membrane biogenesis protein [Oscillospiraceae bacterium]